MLALLLSKFKKKKKVQPTLTERINQQKTKVDSAMHVFTDTYRLLENAQEELDVVISEGTEELIALQETLSAATAERDVNEKYKVKLAEFVPGIE